MKYKSVICWFVLIIYCAESFAQVSSNKDDDNDRWIWSIVDDPDTDNSQINSRSNAQSSTESSAYDPCALYNPPTPSFKAPGRRINEEKCEEHIWYIKLVEERIKRIDECKADPERDHAHTVVGGRPTLPGEIAHMGAIGWTTVFGGFTFKCGCTLISSKFVLTAAHCIRAPPDTTILDPEPKIVRLNDQNLFKDPNKNETEDGAFYFSSDYNISRIIVHPQYKPPKKYFDIALMELAEEVIFTYTIRPACLWNRLDYGNFGKEVSLSGWGVLAEGSLNNSPHLQAANVDIIDSKQCDNLLENSRNRHWMGLMENQLCAGRLEGGVDACQGDSGGPLQFRKPLLRSGHGNLYYVIGVTSFGIGCALPNHPGIYTRVSSFIDWIEEYVWK